MAYSTPARRTIVIRASRDTMVLVASAVAMTFALAYAVHTRPLPVAQDTAPQQDWVGRLAEVAPETKPVPPAEAMTSASLVVPPADLTLPTVPRSAPPKARTCDASPCPAKIVVPLPPARQKPSPAVTQAAAVDPGTAKRGKDGTAGLGGFNPLNHLPDAVRHPFDYAGSTISSWMRRL